MVLKVVTWADLDKLDIALKPAPVKGLSLKYPISSGGGLVGVNDCGLSYLSYGLVCGFIDLSLGDVDRLLSEFEFFLTEHLKRNGVQRISEKYRLTLDMVLANLRLAHLEGNKLCTPTGRRATTFNNPEKIGYSLVKRVIDYLHVKGLIEQRIGQASAHLEQRRPTISWPTAELVAWFEKNKIRPLLHDKAELVELRKKVISHYENSDKNRVKVTKNEPVKIPKKYREHAEKLRRPVYAYNELWLNHVATLEGRYVVPWCRRIFNESFDNGGRFYGSFQQLPKKERDKILIDGFSTVEPDYSGYHINLLYTWEGRQFKGDPYDIEGIDRGLVKAVMLPLLNHENLASLAAQITKSAKPEIKAAYERWQSKQRLYEINRALGVRARQPEKPDYLKGFIEGIPASTQGKLIIEAIKKKHPLIAHHFGTKGIGLKLQKQDSEIMAAVLCKLAANGIPALPIHDSLRVKTINQFHTADIMKSEYKRMTGFDIRVS